METLLVRKIVNVKKTLGKCVKGDKIKHLSERKCQRNKQKVVYSFCAARWLGPRIYSTCVARMINFDLKMSIKGRNIIFLVDWTLYL